MKLMRHFYGARKNIFLEYDFLHVGEHGSELAVRFTRLRLQGADTLETTLPTCDQWLNQGFSASEQLELKKFLEANAADILQEAEKTRGGDNNLVPFEFEVDEDEWLKFCCLSYLKGQSPEESLNEGLRSFVKEWDRTAPDAVHPEVPHNN